MALEHMKTNFNDLLQKIVERKEVALGIGLAAVVVVSWKVKAALKKRKLKSIAKLRREERDAFIETLRKRLNEASLEVIERRKSIVGLKFEQLVDELRNGTVSAKEALEAYQWKAIQAHDTTNSICLFFSQAAEWAEELDRVHKAGAAELPPLFGVPISIKETIQVQGYDSTRGYARSLYDPAPEDAVVIAAIRRLGAIPFAHTNIPQGLFWYGCSNPIYGTTKSPYDPKLTSGGSSGGEAALLALGGSIIGLGGDVGGSIRIPSHFCGVVGLKPSSTRLSQIGSLPSVPGRPNLSPCIGPLARDVDGAVALMRHLTSDEQMAEADAYLKFLPWREDVYKGQDKTKLKIGYCTHDGFMEPTPACRRAVEEARKILVKKGHILVPYQPPNTKDLVRLFIGAALLDGGEYLRRMATTDVLDPYYAPVMGLYGIPAIVKRILGHILRPFSPIASTIMLAAPTTLPEVRSMYEQIDIAKARYVESWRALGLDAIICPSFACTALPHDAPVKLPPATSYTTVFNLLDFAAGVVPVTKVTANDELMIKTGGYVKKEMFSKKIAAYCEKDSIGLPVTVQCVTMPNEEEKCLRVMKDIEEGRIGY